MTQSRSEQTKQIPTKINHFVNSDKVFTHRSQSKASRAAGSWNWYVLLGNTFLLWCQSGWWVGLVGTPSRQPINTDTRVRPKPLQYTTTHYQPLLFTVTIDKESQHLWNPPVQPRHQPLFTISTTMCSNTPPPTIHRCYYSGDIFN